jgi:hypothetical protein
VALLAAQDQREDEGKQNNRRCSHAPSFVTVPWISPSSF